MPVCVECGAERRREEMFGPLDELRCPDCVAKRRQVYEAPRRTVQIPDFPFVTALCAGVAMIATAVFQSRGNVDWMVMLPDAIWDGELWRLITTVFLHGGPLRGVPHLVFNLAWLIQFGRVIEGWTGPVRYAGFIVLAALGSNAIQFLFSGPAIGLSGVVFAMFGLLFALRKRKDFAAEQMQPQIIQVLVVSSVVCILFFSDSVANWAHGGGFLVGWLLGLAVLQPKRRIAIAGVAAFALALVLATQFTWDADYAVIKAHESYIQGDLERSLEWYRRADRKANRQWIKLQIFYLEHQLKNQTAEKVG